MIESTVGFLHPGAMGASLAAHCSGRRIWAGADRSSATHARAAASGAVDVGSLERLIEESATIVSICPPGAALDVARTVAERGFTGVYVDANAISPDTARSIGGLFDRFVDGGVIGPPAGTPGLTRLYLSGGAAGPVAELWAGTALETRVVDGGAGAASAVKMCFAAWTKGSAALLLAIRALATAEGVDGDLLAEWAISQPDLAVRSDRAAAGFGPKAWRFADEMREIAVSFDAHGLPEGFGTAAADVYGRLAEFKDTPDVALGSVVHALLAPTSDDNSQ